MQRWNSGGVRVLVVVADVTAAVWCGGLVGEMAGKRGVSLVGGEELLLSDVGEHTNFRLISTWAVLGCRLFYK